MPTVGQNGTIIHDLKVRLVDGVQATGDGDKDVTDAGCFEKWHNLVSIHDGFNGADGVDLGHYHLRSHAAGPHGYATAAPAVAANHHILAGPEDVRGAGDAVDGALSRAVTVVEEMLGLGVIHRDDGVFQLLVLRHAAQSDHAGGGFLHAPYDGAGQSSLPLVESSD